MPRKITEREILAARVSNGLGFVGSSRKTPEEYIVNYQNALFRLWNTPFKLEPLEEWQSPAKRETRVRVTCLKCDHICKESIKMENLLQYDRIKHPCDRCMSPYWLDATLKILSEKFGHNNWSYELHNYPGRKAKIKVINGGEYPITLYKLNKWLVDKRMKYEINTPEKPVVHR